MLNPEVLKCHKDLFKLEMYNKEKQKIISFSYGENIKIFGYLGACWGGGGASIIRLLDWDHLGSHLPSLLN